MWSGISSVGNATSGSGNRGSSGSSAAIPGVYGRLWPVSDVMARTALVWFRRDLRLHDHPALQAAVAEYDRVVPVFVLDDALLRGRYRSDARGRWMLACLAQLDEALRERGSGLTVLHGPPERELPRLGADAVFWTS